MRVLERCHCANHVMASPPPVSVLPVEVYGLLFAIALAVLVTVFWRHNHWTHREEYSHWNRSFICRRCGAISELGPGEILA